MPKAKAQGQVAEFEFDSMPLPDPDSPIWQQSYRSTEIGLKIPLPAEIKAQTKPELPDEWFWEQRIDSWWHAVHPEPRQLVGHTLELFESHISNAFDVELDGEKIGFVRMSNADPFRYFQKAWRPSVGPGHDKYIAPWDAAAGFAMRVLRNEMAPDWSPVLYRIEYVKLTGNDISMKQFYAIMEAEGWELPNGKRVPKPGLETPFRKGAFHIKP